MCVMNELQKKLIIQHSSYPQNHGLVQDDSYLHIRYQNNSCGDAIDLQIKIVDGVIFDIKHDTQACAVCCASASLMSVHLKKKTISETLNKVNHFLGMVKDKNYDETQIDPDLKVFNLLKQPSSRVLCISLPWEAIQKNIEKNHSSLK
ncbi:iron-sulfur cluster assembly scaffold protein [Italian clover phyllody phytoplasma]|uniref:iron-sulfur cluster assembly scaffold protein n=1 Tax=Italian clover phyllody phytoplasma TaxID=1196420 RepID=UPI0002D4C39F|nr:iron-sulfur cluster assembly scaffold protein [Italian clover phyllody phytoplasma]